MGIKKTFIIALAVLLVSSIWAKSVSARITIPWVATSTTQGWIFPDAINGLNPAIVVPWFIGTSTTATSTLAGSLSVGTTTSLTRVNIQPLSGSILLTFASQGWTSTGWNAGDPSYVHSAGNTNVLSNSSIFLNGSLYDISFVLTSRTAGSVTVALCGTTLQTITSNGSYTYNNIYCTTGSSGLTFTPTTDFDGNLNTLTVFSEGTQGLAFYNRSGVFGLLMATINGAGLLFTSSSTIATSGMMIDSSGNVGIGTTTPGTLLSIGNTNGINFNPTATSSLGSSANGINITNGCYAVLNVCISLANLTGIVPVANGGTGSSSWGQGWFGVNDSGAFLSSTSPTVNIVVATSTTATSTFPNLQVKTREYIGTVTSVASGTDPILSIQGFNNNSSLKVGTIELQGFGLNNTWFGENVYYDNVSFKARATGSAGLFYFQGGASNAEEGQFRMSNTGYNGGTTITAVLPLKVSGANSGTVAFGGNISTATTNFTSATAIATSTELLINQNLRAISGVKFSKGASATTTIQVGEQSLSTSKACFNVQNDSGTAISFYFHGTSMIIENNVCK